MTVPQELFRFLATEPVLETLRLMIEAGEAPSMPSILVDGFSQHGWYDPYGGIVTLRGRTTLVGADLVVRADAQEAMDRLRRLDPSGGRLELLRHGITDAFLAQVAQAERIKRIMICSPWVALSTERLRSFQTGVERTRRATGFNPEIFVVTRPPVDQAGGVDDPTMRYLNACNSALSYRKSVHSKLYILELAGHRPQFFAYVGSENFTKPRYDEVGIRIHNDLSLIQDLQHYFLSLHQS